MNLDQYHFRTNASHLDFEFESIGPNGNIQKVVRFSPQNTNGITYFNLGFGDVNPTTGTIDDLSKSNNGDKNKILATIASIVLEFTAHFPDVMVYAQGSTPPQDETLPNGNLSKLERNTSNNGCLRICRRRLATF